MEFEDMSNYKIKGISKGDDIPGVIECIINYDQNLPSSILDCISDHVKNDEDLKVAIVGVSGDGKSTLWGKLAENNPMLKAEVTHVKNKECKLPWTGDDENACKSRLFTTIESPSELPDVDLFILLQPESKQKRIQYLKDILSTKKPYVEITRD